MMTLQKLHIFATIGESRLIGWFHNHYSHERAYTGVPLADVPHLTEVRGHGVHQACVGGVAHGHHVVRMPVQR